MNPHKLALDIAADELEWIEDFASTTIHYADMDESQVDLRAAMSALLSRARQARIAADEALKTPAKEETRVDPFTLLNETGGEWLGAARSWIQNHAINGSDVTWGSQDQLRRGPLSVHEVERFAAQVAAAAINEDRKKRR